MSPLLSVPSVSGSSKPVNELGYVRENLVAHYDAGAGDVGNSTYYAYNLVKGPRADSNNHRIRFINRPSYTYRNLEVGNYVSYWDFDGSNDYGIIDGSGSASDFAFSTSETDDFTIEAWCNIEAVGSTDFLIGKWGGSNSNVAFLFGWESNRYQGMAWRNTSGSWHRCYTTDSSNRLTGVWVHMVWTFRRRDPDNSNKCHSCLYYNGVQTGGAYNPFTGWTNYGVTSGGSRLCYVGVTYYYSWAFNGKLSIMRIYAGKALTASEVKRNYNAEGGHRFGKIHLT